MLWKHRALHRPPLASLAMCHVTSCKSRRTSRPTSVRTCAAGTARRDVRLGSGPGSKYRPAPAGGCLKSDLHRRRVVRSTNGETAWAARQPITGLCRWGVCRRFASAAISPPPTSCDTARHPSSSGWWRWWRSNAPNSGASPRIFSERGGESDSSVSNLSPKSKTSLDFMPIYFECVSILKISGTVISYHKIGMKVTQIWGYALQLSFG